MSWTKDEKNALKESFRGFIARGVLPRKADCENAKKAFSCLQERNWSKIRSQVKNIINTNKRNEILK